MIRHLFALLLALTLAASSVSAAVMQSEMQGAQQMVICSDSPAGSGLTTITLDATGKPIDRAHHCPDCTAAIAALIPDGVQFGPQNTATTPANPLLTPGRASTTTPAQSARDPPTFA